MKVVHLVTSLDFGGLERRMEILSLFPSESNHYIFCALGGGGATYKKMVSNGADVTLLKSETKIFRIQTYLKLRNFLKEKKPQVLHTHGGEANFYGHLAAIGLGINIRISEEIGIPEYSRLSRFVFSKVLMLSQAMIAMSPVVKDFLSSEGIVKKDKIHLVYNPVLLSESKKEKKAINKLRFVFIGRLEEVKNPLGLLRSFHSLLLINDNVELIYVGDGRQREAVNTYASEHNISRYVNCLGFNSDPLSIVRTCDVVVQPSHTEGFSLALVEAISCGLPAVVTPVGSAKTLIENDVNGWVVDSSQDEDIFLGLKKALNNKNSLLRMGETAANKVSEKHNPRLYSERLDEFYMSLEFKI